MASDCHPPELAVVEIDNGLPDFLRGVHHERAVADDGLVQRLSGNQQRTRAWLAAQRDAIAFVGQNGHALYGDCGHLFHALHIELVAVQVQAAEGAIHRNDSRIVQLLVSVDEGVGNRHHFVTFVSGNTIFADTTYAQNRSDLNEVHSMFTKEKHENSHA